MDEALIFSGITGFICGIGASAVNTFLHHRSLKKQLNFAISKGELRHYTDQKTIAGDITGIIQTDTIKSDILELFDNFMAHQLTAKMPVLNMFMDDKLIAEIRVIFHDEMESHLPALMQKNLLNDEMLVTFSGLIKSAFKKYLKRSRSQILFYLLISGLVGGLIGFSVACFK